MQSTLLSLFSQMPDPRRGQGKMYALAPILLFTVLAMQRRAADESARAIARSYGVDRRTIERMQP